ncbi:hypothetical protein Tdes44962_MAKER00810 [Teratosphaeria destructans]|uniref:Uncharacterized protein n=1 Tax=Teratosphaeria destructans TaxID=418781 RepID=A0A9W7SL51_9PEZI|nr:hypothetical protein Tdes44962_MAKER00810 [Teratosphaeria destructans]
MTIVPPSSYLLVCNITLISIYFLLSQTGMHGAALRGSVSESRRFPIGRSGRTLVAVGSAEAT